jgi:cell division protein FtsL
MSTTIHLTESDLSNVIQKILKEEISTIKSEYVLKQTDFYQLQQDLYKLHKFFEDISTQVNSNGNNPEYVDKLNRLKRSIKILNKIQ